MKNSNFSRLSRQLHTAHLTQGVTISFYHDEPIYIRADTRTFKLDFSWLDSRFDWSSSIFDATINLLETRSVDYSHQCNYYSRRFIRDVLLRRLDVASPIKLSDFEDWIERYGVSTWPFMQAILVRCVENGCLGIGLDVQSFLTQPTKWEEKGNGRYFALITNDPERGALTEQELLSVQFGLNLAYQQRRISTLQWTVAWTFIGTGLRPVQLARMRVGDLIITEGPEGKEITLLVPLAKQRTKNDARWRRKSPTQLTEVLLNYLNEYNLHKELDAPLLLDQSVQIQNIFRVTFDAITTYSDRLNGPVPMFPYRLRYTLGTRSIALGASDHVVARLLTHSTTASIQHYRASLPSLQAPLKNALGDEMSYFARAFTGRLVSDLSEATRRDDPSALIKDFASLMGQSLGACGTMAKCHQDAPRACLTCHLFEPFKEAPWADLRKTLVADMNAEIEERIKLITKQMIDAVDQIACEIAASNQETDDE